MPNAINSQTDTQFPLLGLRAESVDNLKGYLEQGIFQKDLTKLKDLMLSAGRKMLDPQYRENYARKLGEIISDLGKQLEQTAQTGVVSGPEIMEKVTCYFEVLNRKRSPIIQRLREFAQDREITDHAVKVCILAMIVADELKFSPREVIDIGQLALLSKISIINLPASIRQLNRPANAIEQLEIKKLPQLATSWLEQLSGLTSNIPAIANQIYERGDGTGFPRGLILKNTNPLARILRAVDCYVSLLETKPFRPPIQPCTAIIYLLQQAQQDILEPRSVTTIANLVGIYPAGTWLQLSDETCATVLGNSTDLKKPHVQLELTGEACDLSTSDLSVLKTVPSPEREEITDWTQVVEWIG